MNTHWKKNVLDLNAPTNVDAISDTVEWVFDAIEMEGLDSVNFIGLDADEINAEHLCAALRATSTWKEEVKGWHEGINIAFKALVKQGIEPQEALYGLIPKK